MKKNNSIERKHTFRQSKNWWCKKDLDWLIENASFACNMKCHNGHRPRIITKKEINGMNMFELDNDKWGILIKGESNFKGGWQDLVIKDSMTKDVEGFLVQFFNGYGCQEFVDPTFDIFKELRYTECKIV